MVKMVKKLLGPYLIIAFAGIFLVASVYFFFNAKTIGEAVGTMNGKIVGTAIGSAKGVTDGVAKGQEDGREAGLSAEDTQVEIRNTFSEIALLNVMDANITFSNMGSIGKTTKTLYITEGKVKYTVDISKAIITFENDNVIVTVPLPEADVYMKQKDDAFYISKGKNILTNDKDGHEAFINSMEKLYENSRDKANSDEELMQSAKKAAVNQITQLVNTVCGNDINVSVKFMDTDK